MLEDKRLTMVDQDAKRDLKTYGLVTMSGMLYPFYNPAVFTEWIQLLQA